MKNLLNWKKFGRPLSEYFNFERTNRALKLLEEEEERDRKRIEEREERVRKEEEYYQKQLEFRNIAPSSEYASIELEEGKDYDEFLHCFQYLDELAQAFQKAQIDVIISLYKNEKNEKYMEIKSAVQWTNEYFDVPLYSDIKWLMKRAEIQDEKAKKEYEEKERRANSPEMRALAAGHHK